MVVDYRDDSPFTDDLHTTSEIADALRHKKYGVDVREAIAQAVEKMVQTGRTIYSSGTPAGAFSTLDALQSAYPNGQDGVFVVAETGDWYTWNPRTRSWEDGGPYQSPMATAEVEDGRVWADGTVSTKIGDAIRGQFNQVKSELEQVESTHEDLSSRIKYHETALELKGTRLRDDDGNLIWDDSNNYLTGLVTLPKTDKTGLEDGVPIDSSVVGYTFLGHLKEYGLPILKMTSEKLPTITKHDGKLHDVTFEYDPNGGFGSSFSGVLKSVKVKGNTSQFYPKKSLNITFNEDVQLQENWGKRHKYSLMADWVDFSHIRNEMSADLWRAVRLDRLNAKRDVLVDESNNMLVDSNGNNLSGETQVQLAMGLNLGAIQAVPILVVINDVYHGLYSLTVPKDDWMAGMGNKSDGEAILSAENNPVGSGFKGQIQVDDDGNVDSHDFEVEFVSDEDNQTWIPEKLNEIVDLLENNGDPTSMVDLDSLIDYISLELLMAGTDNVIHNYLLDTWNKGETWFFMPYDMDATYGNRWNADAVQSVDHFTIEWLNYNALFQWAIENKTSEFKARWNQLRSNQFSAYSLNERIQNRVRAIPKAVYDYEQLRWPNLPNTHNDHNQIWQWLSMRLDYLDKQITNL